MCYHDFLHVCVSFNHRLPDCVFGAVLKRLAHSNDVDDNFTLATKSLNLRSKGLTKSNKRKGAVFPLDVTKPLQWRL